MPIVPGESAAGISIGMHYETVCAVLGKESRSITILDSVLACEFCSCINVTFEKNIVREIGVRRGYAGLTAAGIGPGASWQKLSKVYPTILFEGDAAPLWIVPGLLGVGFQISRPKTNNEPVEVEVDFRISDGDVPVLWEVDSPETYVRCIFVEPIWWGLRSDGTGKFHEGKKEKPR